MKSNDELDKVELPALLQLQQLGWQYIPGAMLSPESGERDYLRDVVLVNRLNSAIKRLNPWISDENLRKNIQTAHPPTANRLNRI